MSKFTHLFQPLQIKTTEFRNRVAMAPMNHNLADPDGRVTERLVNYYAERAKGGAALIITSATVIDPRAKKRPGELCVYSDEFLPGLKSLVDAVHAEGAKIFLQIYHGGGELRTGTNQGVSVKPVGPTALRHPFSGEMLHELSIEEMGEIRDAFARSAVRAEEVGFDGVEIHGSHGYLLTQFVHPFFNRRTDEYGGGFEGRIRLPLEVARSVRQATGNNFLIDYRMNGTQFFERGKVLPHEESVALAARLSEFVDLLHVSSGSNQTPKLAGVTMPLMSTPQGCYAHLAGRIREAVDVPVITVGRIKRPEMADSIIASGQADMVALGRAMLTDPHWARKAQAGEEGQIRPCIACDQGCIEYLFLDRSITCLHNPTVGYEKELALSPAEDKKRVLIVGGGVGGMEAARVAALRGHDVEIWERSARLGGNVNLASANPWKTEFTEVVDYLVRQIERLEVRVKLETDGSAEKILDYAPDVLILATGGKPKELCDFDAGGAPMLLAEEVLSGRIGDLVTPVCVIGGGMVGLETACLLAAIGHEVEVVEMLSDAGLDMGPINRAFWKDKLAELNVSIHTDCEVLGCEECSLRAKSVNQPETHLLGPHGSYVIAVGYDPNDSLKRELDERAPAAPFPIHTVGDCVFPRNALQAISEGYRVAFSL